MIRARVRTIQAEKLRSRETETQMPENGIHSKEAQPTLFRSVSLLLYPMLFDGRIVFGHSIDGI